MNLTITSAFFLPSRSRRFLCGAVLAGTLAAGTFGCVQPVLAQTQTMGMSASKQSELMGATTGLGSSHRFATISAAETQCPGDTIVWGSGNGLTYMLAGSAGYGTAKPGFYACKAEADSAGFNPAK